MPANNDPIYTRTPDIQLGGAVLGNSNNTATDGTGANITSIFQADSLEGGFVSKIILKPVGTVAATVGRIFICSVTGAFTPGTSNTAANTALIAEISLPAITSSSTAAQPQFEIPLNIPIPAGWRLLFTTGTATGASVGYAVTTIGGKY